MLKSWRFFALVILIVGLVLTAYLCIRGGGGSDTPPAEPGISEQIKASLQEGKTVAEVENPGFALPSGIHEGQVNKYFQLGDIYFALVLNRSMNVYLEDVPNDFDISFVGALVSTEVQARWGKYLEVKDKAVTDKNNPYYLWSEGEKIFLTVVDQNGAGSGEGVLKLVSSQLGSGWVIEGCYYFGEGIFPSGGGDYFSASKDLSKHEKLPMKRCGNLVIEEKTAN